MIENKIPLVSIISINYNSEANTIELINSIKKNNYKNFEIIIIDNASENDPSELFQTKFPDILYRRSDVNLGFAGGNNLGIQLSNGEFLYFVNNDIVLTFNVIGNLVKILIENPKIGLLSPKILYYKTNTIQYAGFTSLNKITARNKAIGHRHKDSELYTKLMKTSYVHGAAMMTRRKIINEVGLMPEIYFLYYEELDWSEMIKKEGYEIWVDQTSIVYHKESMSIGKSNPLKIYYQTRNRILYVKRNWPITNRLMFYFYFYLFVFPVKCCVYLIKGNNKKLYAFLSGVFNIKKGERHSI